MKWQCATVFGGAGLTGSLIGAHLAKQVDGGQLLLWFALTMALIGGSMLLPRKFAGDPGVHLTPALTARLTPARLAAGLAAGFYGIGGGFLIVPGLVAAPGMTLARAAASSANYAVSRLVDWPVFAAAVAGGAPGALAGVPVARRLAGRADTARRIFALMAIATGAYVAWRSLT